MMALDKYSITGNMVSGKYFYQSSFYEKIGQEQKLSEAYATEANYLMSIPADKLESLNQSMLEEAKAGITAQLKAMNVPESSWEASLAQHPQIFGRQMKVWLYA